MARRPSISISAKMHRVDRLRGVAKTSVPKMTPSLASELKDIARDIAALARQLVRKRKGKLLRSIRVKEIEPTKWQVVAGNRTAFYAHFVEKGTSHSRRYPFLRPAFDAYRDEIRKRIAKSVMRGIRAASRGGRGRR